jgi:hypothetical protein
VTGELRMVASNIRCSPQTAESPLSRALALMTSALQLLDQSAAPHEIGAHLDLAIVRLSEVLECPWPVVTKSE